MSAINSPFGFNNLGGRLNNLCRDLSFIEEAAETETEMEGKRHREREREREAP